MNSTNHIELKKNAFIKNFKSLHTNQSYQSLELMVSIKTGMSIAFYVIAIVIVLTICASSLLYIIGWSI